jgi:catecholate siderophore receptor
MKNFKSKPVYLAVILALASPIGSHAEEQSETLPEVDVLAHTLQKNDEVDGYLAKRTTAATRTDTPLTDVPQSISVVTQDQIEDQGIQSVTDAVRYVPGVTPSQGEGNRDALNFRGAGVTTGDFYVDGLRDDIQTFRDFYNVERIEVLKGPNGLIFGRAAAGGLINRVTKEAGWDSIRELTVSGGMFDHKRAAIDIGDALSDSVAFRLNAVYEDSGSYREGVDLERYGVNPTFTIRPSENTRIVLGAEYFEDKRVGDRGVPSVNGPGDSRKGNRPFDLDNSDEFFGNDDLSPNETETKALNAMIEHVFDNGLIVRNRTRYADYDKFYQNVYAGGPVRNNGLVAINAYRDETDRENLINQTDLIYDLKTGAIEHKLLFGMEFVKQDTNNSRISPNGGGDGTGVSVPVSNPEFEGPNPFLVVRRDRSSDVDNRAFYVQDQITFSPMWEALIGLRHDSFEVDHTNRLDGEKIDSDDNFVSPKAALIFKPIENVSFYGAYSLSYVPRAGDQLTDLTFDMSSFDPEKFINKEIGAKWDVTPRLSLTAAIYRLDREKVAVANPDASAANPLILVDNQETKGVELGIAGRITSAWSVFGGYAYQDAEITKQQGTGSGAILKGTELGQTPEHTFSLWNRYDFNDTWGAALGVISRSDMFAATPTATQSTILPGYTRLDAAIFARLDKNLRLQVNIENLTNKEYALYAHNNDNITPGSPTAARATLIYNF